MDDSSLFMEWAMDTLQQHEHLPAADCAAAYHFGGGDIAFVPSLQELRGGSTLQEGQVQHQATNSWSSGDADSAGGGGRGGGTAGTTSSAVVEQHDDWSSNSVQCAPSSSVGSTNYRPVSWNFTSAVAQPNSETTAPNPCGGLGTAPSIPCADGSGASPRASKKRSAAAAAAASTGHTSSPKPCAQDHIIAERNRREKINRRFIELSTVIPGLKKMDKATILSDAVRYVKEQQEKLKALEDRNGGSGGRTIKSAVLAKKQCIAAAAAAAPSGGGGGCHPSSAAGTNRDVVLPEIEARISEPESSVMVRIHCEDGKGVLVGLLAEVEGLHLAITSTSVISFPACTLVITVVAKMEEGFSVTPEDIVATLNSALLNRSTQHSAPVVTYAS